MTERPSDGRLHLTERESEKAQSKYGRELSSSHLLKYSAYTGISYGFPHKIFISSSQASGFPVRAETKTAKEKKRKKVQNKMSQSSITMINLKEKEEIRKQRVKKKWEKSVEEKNRKKEFQITIIP